MPLYYLKQDADGIVLVFNAAGQQVIKLEGGYGEVIVMSYLNICRIDQARGDDYMAGVIAGIMHCHMLRPDAFSPLPPL